MITTAITAEVAIIEAFFFFFGGQLLIFSKKFDTKHIGWFILRKKG